MRSVFCFSLWGIFVSAFLSGKIQAQALPASWGADNDMAVCESYQENVRRVLSNTYGSGYENEQTVFITETGGPNFCKDTVETQVKVHMVLQPTTRVKGSSHLLDPKGQDYSRQVVIPIEQMKNENTYITASYDWRAWLQNRGTKCTDLYTQVKRKSGHKNYGIPDGLWAQCRMEPFRNRPCSDIAHCETCNLEGQCAHCNLGYGLSGNSCRSCNEISPHCSECSGEQCIECGPGYELIGNACRSCEGMCKKRLNEITWLMSHNATSLAKEGFSTQPLCLFLSGGSRTSPLAAQSATFTLEKQLKAGIRGFKLPLMEEGNQVWICHPKIIQAGNLRLSGSESCQCDFARRPADEVFRTIKKFLDENPREMILVLLDNYASTEIAKNYLVHAGLDKLAHAQDPRRPWPTLEKMIKENKRFVIFNSLSFAAQDHSTANAPAWLNHHPDFIVSSYDDFYTSSSAFSSQEKICSKRYLKENKPKYFEISGIYSLGYHGYRNIAGAPIAGSERIATEINKDVFKNVQSCKEYLGRSPTLVQMDFVDIPDVYENLRAIQKLNE